MIRICNRCNKTMTDCVTDELFCSNCGNPEFRLYQSEDDLDVGARRVFDPNNRLISTATSQVRHTEAKDERQAEDI